MNHVANVSSENDLRCIPCDVIGNKSTLPLTNADFLWMGPLGTGISETMVEITDWRGFSQRSENCYTFGSWWRHQMEIFSALLAFCAGNSPHKGKWRGALVFSLIRALNKWLSKQSRCWWFETPSSSLWRHCNDIPSNIVLKLRPRQNIVCS